MDHLSNQLMLIFLSKGIIRWWLLTAITFILGTPATLGPPKPHAPVLRLLNLESIPRIPVVYVAVVRILLWQRRQADRYLDGGGGGGRDGWVG